MPTTTISRCGGGTTPGATYPQIVAAVGPLVGYWRMGALSGDQPDISGFAPTKDMVYAAGIVPGTYHVTGADVLVASGQDDGAFQFNYNQPVDKAPAANQGDTFSADDAKFDFPGNLPYSVACFAYIGSSWLLPAGKSAPLVSQRSTANFHGFTLETNIAGDLICRRGSTVAWSTVTASGVLAAGSWRHCCMTYDGTTIRVYVNGGLATSGASALVQAIQTKVALGGVRFQDEAGSPDRFFYGAIDEVSIWNVALSAAAVAALAAG